MKHFLFIMTIMAQINAFAITRVVNCFDQQTNVPEIQIVLRGGVATLNVCTKDICSTSDMEYSQTLTLRSEEGTWLHYGLVQQTPAGGPVRETMDLRFIVDKEINKVDVMIDSKPVDFHCI